MNGLTSPALWPVYWGGRVLLGPNPGPITPL